MSSPGESSESSFAPEQQQEEPRPQSTQPWPPEKRRQTRSMTREAFKEASKEASMKEEIDSQQGESEEDRLRAHGIDDEAMIKHLRKGWTELTDHAFRGGDPEELCEHPLHDTALAKTFNTLDRHLCDFVTYCTGVKRSQMYEELPQDWHDRLERISSNPQRHWDDEHSDNDEWRLRAKIGLCWTLLWDHLFSPTAKSEIPWLSGWESFGGVWQQIQEGQYKYIIDWGFIVSIDAAINERPVCLQDSPTTAAEQTAICIVCVAALQPYTPHAMGYRLIVLTWQPLSNQSSRRC